MVNLYSVKGLLYGPHSILVEIADAKNSNSRGTRIEIDAFDVMP